MLAYMMEGDIRFTRHAKNRMRWRKISMRIEYDREADAVYIWLTGKKEVSQRTVEFQDGVLADIGKNKKIIGVEILDFAKRLKRPRAHAIEFSVPEYRELMAG